MNKIDYKHLYFEYVEKTKRLESDNRLLSSRLDYLVDKYSVDIADLDKEIKAKLLNNKYNNIDANTTLVTKSSPLIDKVNLYLTIFQGREDVCAVRWKNLNTGN